MSALLTLPLAVRTDRPAWLIAIPIAVAVAMGFFTAWFVYCQMQGGWPAVDMPSWEAGGTWKVYCAR